jgi:2-methylcitrate dehydratase PrpD
MTHPMFDGLIEIRREFAPDPAQIAEIGLRLYPHATQYLNRPEVTTGLAGKFSAQYCAAIALLDGQAQEPQFTDARARDPVLHRLAERVRLIAVEGMPIDQCEVEVRLNDGQTHRQRINVTSGSPAKPMSWDDLAVKFKGLAGLSCNAARVDVLLERLAAWPSTEAVGSLLALTLP